MIKSIELINYDEIDKPDSDYISSELINSICEDVQEQIAYLDDIYDVACFEPEISHGYTGGTLHMSNTELLENLDLIDKLIDSGVETTISKSDDIYKLIADGIHLEAIDIASIYVHNIQDYIERNLDT